MGIHAVLAALDESRRTALERAPDPAIDDAVAAGRRDEPWVLDLGKDGMFIDAALRAHDAGPAARAVDLGKAGQPVGGDGGYGRARYLVPAEVAAIAASLAALDDDVFPQPDPDGYAPDPRLDSDARLQRVAKAIDLLGADSDNRDWMDALAALLGDVRTFYSEAAARGDGVLMFLT